MKNEPVMVVSREKLFGKNNERYFEGFKTINETDFFNLIEQNFIFMPRKEAEENPDFLQTIAFIVVKKGKEFFASYKLEGTGDKRELGMHSIAVGGHINPVDVGENVLYKGAEREFFEEVNYHTFNGKPIGFVNFDTDMFNKVHFGVVFLQEVDRDVDINDAEKHIMAGKMRTVPEMRQMRHKFGLWSQAILDNIKTFL